CTGMSVAQGGPKNHCYLAAKELVSWDQARMACKAWRAAADLACIADDAENTFVQQPFLSIELVWLGAHVNPDGKTFAWVTGEPFDWTDWKPPEPNHMPGDDCVALWQGGWQDVHCDMGYYVCEYPAK